MSVGAQSEVVVTERRELRDDAALSVEHRVVPVGRAEIGGAQVFGLDTLDHISMANQSEDFPGGARVLDGEIGFVQRRQRHALQRRGLVVRGLPLL